MMERFCPACVGVTAHEPGCYLACTQSSNLETFFDRVASKAIDIHRYPLALFAVCKLCGKRTDSDALAKMDPVPGHYKECPLYARPVVQVETTQQPVAWIRGGRVGAHDNPDWDEQIVTGATPPKTLGWTPLYAHPAPEVEVKASVLVVDTPPYNAHPADGWQCRTCKHENPKGALTCRNPECPVLRVNG